MYDRTVKAERDLNKLKEWIEINERKSYGIIKKSGDLVQNICCVSVG